MGRIHVGAQIGFTYPEGERVYNNSYVAMKNIPN
jgi:hypothetical protein